MFNDHFRSWLAQRTGLKQSKSQFQITHVKMETGNLICDFRLNHASNRRFMIFNEFLRLQLTEIDCKNVKIWSLDIFNKKFELIRCKSLTKGF